jgi:hypothetical protein
MPDGISRNIKRIIDDSPGYSFLITGRIVVFVVSKFNDFLIPPMRYLLTNPYSCLPVALLGNHNSGEGNHENPGILL